MEKESKNKSKNDLLIFVLLIIFTGVYFFIEWLLSKENIEKKEQTMIENFIFWILVIVFIEILLLKRAKWNFLKLLSWNLCGIILFTNLLSIVFFMSVIYVLDDLFNLKFITTEVMMLGLILTTINNLLFFTYNEIQRKRQNEDKLKRKLLKEVRTLVQELSKMRQKD